MKHQPIIQAKFWNEYEGLPWKPGALTNTVIQFIDTEGTIARIASRIEQTRLKTHEAVQNAVHAKGIMRYFWWCMRNRYEAQAQRLTKKARSAVLKILRRPTHSLDLKSCFCSRETFEEVTDAWKISQLREDIERSSRFEIWAYKE